MLFGVCIAIVAFYIATVAPSESDWGNRHARGALYNLQIDGFRAGQLNLKAEVPSGLAALSDPYDPRANAPYRDDFHLHDASYFRGKPYSYFGITPAVVLFWPYRELTGHYLFNKEAVVVFCALGFFAGVLILRESWRAYFPKAGVGIMAAAVVALGLATSVPVMLRRPGMWEVAIACAYAFVTLACLALWHALHSPTQRNRWIAVASVAYGLAIGARPSVLFGSIALLVPAAYEWLGRPDSPARRKASFQALACAILPMVIMGAGLEE